MAATFGGGATATPFDYGDFDGDSVNYVNVGEDTGLFGAPELIGDELSFSGISPEFEADSFNGGSVTQDGRFFTIIESLPGQALTSVDISSIFSINLSSSGMADAQFAAALTLTPSILGVDGSDVQDGPIELAELSDLVISRSVEADGAFLPTSAMVTSRFDLAAAAASAGIEGDLTRVQVVVGLELSASSELNSAAQIGLTQFDSLTLTVPEPASAALLLAPLVLCTLRRRHS